MRFGGLDSNTNELDDDTLVRRVAARHEAAFDELYYRHAPAVAAVARRIALDRASADEVVQATFLALWERAPQLADGRPIRGWLVAVARNGAIDLVRRARTTASLALIIDRASVESVEADALANEEGRTIQRALARLDADQRAVVELAYFGGLTQHEIAAITGAPLGTVKGRIRLAMRHLRRSLAPAADEAREHA